MVVLQWASCSSPTYRGAPPAERLPCWKKLGVLDVWMRFLVFLDVDVEKNFFHFSEIREFPQFPKRLLTFEAKKGMAFSPRKVTPHSLKIYIYVYILSSLLYTTYIYIYACVCVFIFIFIITILMILVIPIGKDATYCALSSFRGFEGATTGWFADTIVGPSLKSPLVRNATSRKAGKLQDVVFNPSQNQHISTWLGLDYHPRYGWKQWNTQAVYLKPWVWITLFCTNIIHKKNWVCDYSEDKSPLKRHGQKMFLPAAGPPHKSQRPQRCDWSIPIPTQQHIQDVYIYSNPLYKNTKETGIGL